jgi:uncharacterized protein (TIGR01777 family)
MATVLITGGTGMIGRRLSAMLLEKGYEVIILTRDPGKPHEGADPRLKYAAWDVNANTVDREAIASADHIIHLAGAGIADKRWNNKRKQEIVDSRTKSAALIIEALRDTTNHVRTVVGASAIGWYGPDTPTSRQEGFREDAPAYRDFLGQTCKQWEESMRPVTELGKRLVMLRTGIVLSRSGGALDEFKKPLRWGLASILGDGKQVMSWIQLDDLCKLYIAAIENQQMTGAYNAVSPIPVTDKELVLTLAEQLRGKRFTPIHVPAFVLQLALGEMSIEVLKSATVNANKILATGFHFSYPDIISAIKASV